MHKILPSNHKRNMLTQLRGLGPASAAILSREIFAGRFATRRQLGSYLVRRLYFVLTIRGVDAAMRPQASIASSLLQAAAPRKSRCAQIPCALECQ